MSRRPLFVVAFVGAAALLAACGSDSVSDNLAEKAIEQAGGGDVDIDSDDGTVKVETEDGSYEVDEDGNVQIESEDGSFSSESSDEVPDGWPDDVPVPDGLEIETGTKVAADGAENFSVTGTADGEPGDLLEEMIDLYEGEGFTTESQSVTDAGDDSFASAQFASDEHVVTTTIFGDGPDSSTVSITVSPVSS